MKPAAVGFQCPECVARGAKTVREPRTAFGGRLPSGGLAVTAVLVGLNVLVFLLGEALVDDVRFRFGNVAYGVLPTAAGLSGVAAGETYRLLTAAFLHAGFLHLLLNMLALGTLGPPLEQSLGRLRFAALYLLSALGGSVAGFLLAPQQLISVGASGAVFGLFGAYYVVVRRLGGETRPILGILAVNLVITFAVPFIDWRAHLGGLVTGLLVAAALVYAPRDRRDLVQGSACAGVAVLLAALVVVRRAALLG